MSGKAVRWLWLAGLVAAMACGCGYRVAGKADLLPKNIKTIAIPPFGNATTRHRLSERLSAALTREFISRTRYQIVADPEQADAVLTGSVLRYSAYPVLYDQATGRASGVQVYVGLDLTLRERATGAVLFNRSNWEIRERYEISVDPSAYLEESDLAMARLSSYVARTVVAAILENF
ncbi:MAG TPA: LptE family protein [Bryobacteraceae bacterium]|nr:LptE family protein [Bryobacteraceae bacterium]HOL72665.1 LptE family protein [Bryobacteraceae bacterium]HOQ44031.1 LptE family protein [Bryobacteraceae bacterium]HPU70349.1 LptE family protein [Bryobacteraceae bacterium]